MNNKQNLQYFEAASMRELFGAMQDWQIENKQRLLSLNVERDGDAFCCIALTNPSEVVIVFKNRSSNWEYVDGEKNALYVYDTQRR
jgi:hypothetical protein